MRSSTGRLRGDATAGVPAYAEIMSEARQGFTDNLGEERAEQLVQQGAAMSSEEGHEWMVKVLGEISE